VDSNYDWGQDLEVLEEQWSMLTRANDGIPLRLVYFGFVDPLAVYEMPVAKPSLRGFMGRMRWRGYSFDNWVRDLSAIDDSAVASISALQLNPYGTDFARLRDADELGWVGNCFRVTLSEQFGESKANGKR